jgi:hypothetical protein
VPGESRAVFSLTSLCFGLGARAEHVVSAPRRDWSVYGRVQAGVRFGGDSRGTELTVAGQR